MQKHDTTDGTAEMPADLSAIPDAALYSEIARRRGAKRQHKGGGRPVGYQMSDDAKARISAANTGRVRRKQASAPTPD